MFHQGKKPAFVSYAANFYLGDDLLQVGILRRKSKICFWPWSTSHALSDSKNSEQISFLVKKKKAFSPCPLTSLAFKFCRECCLLLKLFCWMKKLMRYFFVLILRFVILNSLPHYNPQNFHILPLKLQTCFSHFKYYFSKVHFLSLGFISFLEITVFVTINPRWVFQATYGRIHLGNYFVYKTNSWLIVLPSLLTYLSVRK